MSNTSGVSVGLILTVGLIVACGCGETQMGSPFLAGSPGNQQDRYTILLHTASNPSSHVEEVKYYKDQTEKLTGWKGLFIVHKTDHSELYWGKYPTTDEAGKNLKKAKAYRTPLNLPAFPKALIVPLPGEDIGPPEWNLINAKGAHTVLIAIFYDVPEAKYFGRKQNAVAYCRQLREKGEEAYFHHGVSISRVTTGAFPPSAVETIREGNRTSSVIADPRINSIIARYRYLAVNGLSEKHWIINPQTGKPEKVDAKPYLVHIPRKKGDERGGAFDSSGNSQPR